MAIFNSYVSLPEGIKYSQVWGSKNHGVHSIHFCWATERHWVHRSCQPDCWRLENGRHQIGVFSGNIDVHETHGNSCFLWSNNVFFWWFLTFHSSTFGRKVLVFAIKHDAKNYATRFRMWRGVHIGPWFLMDRSLKPCQIRALEDLSSLKIRLCSRSMSFFGEGK